MFLTPLGTIKKIILSCFDTAGTFYLIVMSVRQLYLSISVPILISLFVSYTFFKQNYIEYCTQSSVF